MATRELLATILGVGLGLLFVAYPDVVVQIHTAGRVPGDRRGEYGTDGAAPRRYRLLVRGIGVVLVLVAAFIGFQTFG